MKRVVTAVAIILAAAFFVSPIWAQTPGGAPPVPGNPQEELGFAQQQLTQLHSLYDQLERKAAMINEQAQNLTKQVGDQKIEIQHWQDYYKACRPADHWICDEAPNTPK